MSFTGNGHPIMFTATSSTSSGGTSCAGAFAIKVTRSSPLNTNFAHITFNSGSGGNGLDINFNGAGSTTTYTFSFVDLGSGAATFTDITLAMTELR